MGDPVAVASLVLGSVQTVVGMQEAATQRRTQADQIAQQQEQAALQQRIRERELERARRREEAAARARLGAAGVGSTEGSGAAVLRGLNADFDQQVADGRNLFNASLRDPGTLLDDGPGLSAALGLGQQLLEFAPQIAGVLKADGSVSKTPKQ